MTIRVLEIIPTLHRGGAEKQLTLLASGLPRSEFDVHVCTLTDNGPYLSVLQAHNVPVHSVCKRWKFDPFAYRRLGQIIRSVRPDIVHTWIFAANSYGRMAARGAGVPVIVGGERCVDPWKRWHEFAIDRRLAKYSTCVVTNSHGVRDFYVQHGIAADKFRVIPNGIELPPSPTTTRHEILSELRLPANARLLGAVGRLWPQKRYKDLIWSADLLKCVRDDTYLVILGDGPERERLERYRDRVQIRDRVLFLGERSDVARFLPHFDVLWLASAYEGQSNAVMEAMSYSVPVVATDIPGNRDLVVPGHTGYLVPMGDRRAFARQTKLLLEDESLRTQLGEAGRVRIANEFTIGKMVERHAELYRSFMTAN